MLPSLTSPGCGGVSQRVKDSLSAIHKAQMASVVDEHMRATETCAAARARRRLAWPPCAPPVAARRRLVHVSCASCAAPSVWARRLQEQFHEARSLMEEQRSLLETKYAELQERFTNRQGGAGLYRFLCAFACLCC